MMVAAATAASRTLTGIDGELLRRKAGVPGPRIVLERTPGQGEAAAVAMQVLAITGAAPYAGSPPLPVHRATACLQRTPSSTYRARSCPYPDRHAPATSTVAVAARQRAVSADTSVHAHRAPRRRGGH